MRKGGICRWKSAGSFKPPFHNSEIQSFTKDLSSYFGEGVLVRIETIFSRNLCLSHGNPSVRKDGDSVGQTAPPVPIGDPKFLKYPVQWGFWFNEDEIRVNEAQDIQC